MWLLGLRGYGQVVFATHGYFGIDLPGIQEPVLAFALVNQPKDSDGFLRMTEVMGLSLNTDMVALTACETGLGRRVSGEGIMGMGRAFQAAGARTVLMSLWSVARESSVRLVESFFRHLNEGTPKLQALKLAREEIRKAGYDHPFFWAPFILVGEVESPKEPPAPSAAYIPALLSRR
ncbi:MAG: CHAT domain-containing protein [Thermodesulfobacteriota bacterium]